MLLVNALTVYVSVIIDQSEGYSDISADLSKNISGSFYKLRKTSALVIYVWHIFVYSAEDVKLLFYFIKYLFK